MFTQNSKRAIFILTSSLALTLALGRCGPIAQSINKHSLGDSGPGSLAPQSTVNTAGHSVSGDTLTGEDKVTIKPSWISAGSAAASSSPSPNPSTSAAEATTEISISLNAKQLEELSETNRSQLKLDEVRGLNSFSAKVELSLTANQMKALHLEQVEITLEKKDAENWALQMRSASDDVLGDVLENLAGLTISAGRAALKTN
ncbi:MAG: hypothetical protein H7222_16585 [Methylotenera sp.]|nr:hypothetical protein [Oligoflexia bacterium]